MVATRTAAGSLTPSSLRGTGPSVRQASSRAGVGALVDSRVRVAILADIHGNLSALEAVLDDVERHHADRVVVNGDLVNRAPDGVAVVERVRAVGADLTLGNHDDLMRALVERDDDIPDAFHDDPFWEANRWCARELATSGALETLCAAPMTVRIAPAGAPSVLISHGSPRHFREGYGRYLSAEMVSEISEMHPADVLVGSHTHHPMLKRWGRVTVMNTGAVGVPFNRDARAQYLLLDLVAGAWRPTFRRVAYDVSAALAAFGRGDYLERGGLLARLFHDEIRDARSYLVPYQMWAAERGEALGETSWERYAALHPERFEPTQPWPLETASVPPADR
jgi:predicted phosphodiesterase